MDVGIPFFEMHPHDIMLCKHTSNTLRKISKVLMLHEILITFHEVPKIQSECVLLTPCETFLKMLNQTKAKLTSAAMSLALTYNKVMERETMFGLPKP